MKFVFMIYVARSGSTMLAHRLADRFQDVTVLPEFQLPLLLFQAGDSSVRSMDAASRRQLMLLDPQLKNLSLDSADIDEIAAGSPAGGIRGILESVVARYESNRNSGPTSSVVILKKGNLGFYWRDVIEIFPEAQFVLPIRDPRGTINSMIHTRDPYGPRALMARGDAKTAARYWSRFFNTVADIRDNIGERLVEVRYEDLIDHEQTATDRIGAFLHLPERTDPAAGPVLASEESEMHRLVSLEAVPARSEAWVTELKSWEGVLIEKISANELQREGYELWFTHRYGTISRLFLLGWGEMSSLLRHLAHGLRVLLYWMSHPREQFLRTRLGRTLRMARRDHRRGGSS